MYKRLRTVFYLWFLAKSLLTSIATVVARRLSGGRAHPAWSLPYEVAVDIIGAS